jgi:phosphoglycerate dehydrogenase-like enzyme
MSRPDHRLVVALPDGSPPGFLSDMAGRLDVVLMSNGDDAVPMPDLVRVELLVAGAGARRRLAPELERMPRLRVIQTMSAGVDWLRDRVPDGVIVSNAEGAFDGPLAEWVVAAILASLRGLLTARDAQARGEWTSVVPKELAGRTVVILGYGAIGSAVAERLRPFGVEIVGIARTAHDGVAGMDDIDRLLTSADILVDLLPHTAETDRMLDARRLALLPDGALIVNAGRGRTVDTAALVVEAGSGRVSAALDVTDPEPLPSDHPLWAMPNVLITPHVAGDSAESDSRVWAIVDAQVRRYLAGEPLANRVPEYLLR